MNHDIRVQHIDSFDQTPLNPILVTAFRNLNYNTPTPIQFHALRIWHEHPTTNLIAQSKSGSGKTLAFLSILYEKLLLQQINYQCYALIIEPTRQLAMQVHKVCKSILKDVKVMLAIGGIPFQDDKKAYTNARQHVVIGTVGRIHQMITQNIISTKYLHTLILDEGDKLLSFDNKSIFLMLNQIYVHKVPSIYTMVFSATYTKQILLYLSKQLVDVMYLRVVSRQSDCTVHVTTKVQEYLLTNIEQQVGGRMVRYKLTSPMGQSLSVKIGLLKRVLGELQYKQCMVFVERKVWVEQIYQRLMESKMPSLMIHGSMRQSARIQVMNQAKHQKIILCSDLLARGIDLQLDLVVLFDAKHPQTLLHRAGRTARYDRSGVVIALHDLQEWQIYSQEEVQNHLNLVQLPQVSRRERFGEHISQIGGWREVEGENQIEEGGVYQYVEEGGQQYVEEEEMEIYRKCIHQYKEQFNNQQQFREYIRSVLGCTKCREMMRQIEELTMYKFKIKQYE